MYLAELEGIVLRYGIEAINTYMKNDDSIIRIVPHCQRNIKKEYDD